MKEIDITMEEIYEIYPPDGSTKVYSAEQEQSYTGRMMKKGMANEEILHNWLLNQKDCLEVKDLRDDEWGRKHDVDFIYTRANGDKYGVEVKSDDHISEEGNFCFETQRVYKDSHNRPGWCWFSRADLFLIRNPKTNDLFVFNVKNLRDAVWYCLNKHPGIVRTVLIPSDSSKTTINLLVPMSYLTKAYSAYKDVK